MIAVDTSVAVAAFAPWHEGHASAVAALARRPAIPAHAAAETYSVLTRMPPPHRAPRDIVAEYLGRQYPPRTRLLPKPATMRDLPRIAAAAGIDGGSVYDALVGLTARDHGHTLVTRDLRALPTYEALGVAVELAG